MSIAKDVMRQKLENLGLKEPVSLALLPLNFDTASDSNDLCYPAISKEIERLLQNNGMAADLLDSNEDRYYIDNRSGDVFLPVIIFTLQCISERPDVVSATLELIKNFLFEKFDKPLGRPNVRLRYIRQRPEDYELIEYSGPIEGLAEVRKLKSKTDNT